MKRKILSLADKEVFLAYLSGKRHELSPYAFQNIYIWKGLFVISWEVIGECLCIFFQDSMGCFLYLPPLGKKVQRGTFEEVFGILDSLNQNPRISRIENVEEESVALYQGLGYKTIPKPCDYLCKREDLAQLGGNRFKSQRASFNYFIKHYQYEYRAYIPQDKNGCLGLYDAWKAQRTQMSNDPLYRGMLEDSRNVFIIMLGAYRDLQMVGRVVEIEGEIAAFTFGFRLNSDTFCILYEVTDLAVKGLAQFIFREFCRELSEYAFINIMDDSGLVNLKTVKRSYHPVRLIPNYIATR